MDGCFGSNLLRRRHLLTEAEVHGEAHTFILVSLLIVIIVLSADFCYCTKDVFSTAIEADAYLSPVSTEQFPESEAQQLLQLQLLD